MLRALAAMALALLLAAGCSSGGSAPQQTPQTTATRTVVHTRAPSTAPVVAGPTSSAKAACPFISRKAVAADLGMRLDRMTVQRSGGEAIGCRFYPLAHPTAECGEACFKGERLPPASQPVLQLLITRYPSASAAHNAMVLASHAGKNTQRVSVGGRAALAFQTGFYPKDDGKDWAVAFTRGTRLVRIDTVVTSGSLSVITAAGRIAAKLG